MAPDVIELSSDDEDRAPLGEITIDSDESDYENARELVLPDSSDEDGDDTPPKDSLTPASSKTVTPSPPPASSFPAAAKREPVSSPPAPPAAAPPAAVAAATRDDAPADAAPATSAKTTADSASDQTSTNATSDSAPPAKSQSPASERASSRASTSTPGPSRTATSQSTGGFKAIYPSIDTRIADNHRFRQQQKQMLNLLERQEQDKVGATKLPSPLPKAYYPDIGQHPKATVTSQAKPAAGSSTSGVIDSVPSTSQVTAPPPSQPQPTLRHPLPPKPVSPVQTLHTNGSMTPAGSVQPPAATGSITAVPSAGPSTSSASVQASTSQFRPASSQVDQVPSSSFRPQPRSRRTSVEPLQPNEKSSPTKDVSQNDPSIKSLSVSTQSTAISNQGSASGLAPPFELQGAGPAQSQSAAPAQSQSAAPAQSQSAISPTEKRPEPPKPAVEGGPPRAPMQQVKAVHSLFIPSQSKRPRPSSQGFPATTNNVKQAAYSGAGLLPIAIQRPQSMRIVDTARSKREEANRQANMTTGTDSKATLPQDGYEQLRDEQAKLRTDSGMRPAPTSVSQVAASSRIQASPVASTSQSPSKNRKRSKSPDDDSDPEASASHPAFGSPRSRETSPASPPRRRDDDSSPPVPSSPRKFVGRKSAHGRNKFYVKNKLATGGAVEITPSSSATLQAVSSSAVKAIKARKRKVVTDDSDDSMDEQAFLNKRRRVDSASQGHPSPAKSSSHGKGKGFAVKSAASPDKLRLDLSQRSGSNSAKRVHGVLTSDRRASPLPVEIDTYDHTVMITKARKQLDKYLEEESAKPSSERRITGPEIMDGGRSELVKSPQILARKTLERQMKLIGAQERFENKRVKEKRSEEADSDLTKTKPSETAESTPQKYTLADFLLSEEAEPLTRQYTALFESIIEFSNARERPRGAPRSRIRVIPHENDRPPFAPDFFGLIYTNRVYYSAGIVPTQAAGCDCIGDCNDPKNRASCACRRRQTWSNSIKSYAPENNDHSEREGFAYNEEGCIWPDVLDHQEMIWECNSTCSCSRSCINRVVGNKLEQSVDIFYTGPEKGWGVRNPPDMPMIKRGKPLGLYAGELLPMNIAAQREIELQRITQKRPVYLYDIDHWTVAEELRNPERKVDPDQERFARWVRSCVKEADAPVGDDSDEDDDDDGEDAKYGLYTVDATSSGNWTRFCNHSCSNFNTGVRSVIVDDGDVHRSLFVYVAMEDIMPGEEICISYYNSATKPRLARDQTVRAYQEEARKVREAAETWQRCRCGESLCRGVMFS